MTSSKILLLTIFYFFLITASSASAANTGLLHNLEQSKQIANEKQLVHSEKAAALRSKELLSHEEAKKKMKRGFGLLKPASSKVVEVNGKKIELIRGKDNKVYQLTHQIGKGSFGTVHKAVDLETNKTVALKRLALSHLPPKSSEVVADLAEREIGIHRKLGTLEGEPIIEKSGITIPMKYREGQTLGATLLDPKSHHSPVKVYQNAKAALIELHNSGVTHGDVNLENFVVGSKGQVNTIDHGASREFGEKVEAKKTEIEEFQMRVGDQVKNIKNRPGTSPEHKAKLDKLTTVIRNQEKITSTFADTPAVGHTSPFGDLLSGNKSVKTPKNQEITIVPWMRDYQYAKSNGRIFENVNVSDLPKNSAYTYLVTEHGDVRYGKTDNSWEIGTKHWNLAQGEKAKAAGELQIDPNGHLKFNLLSGTYTRKLKPEDQTNLEKKLTDFFSNQTPDHQKAESTNATLIPQEKAPSNEEITKMCSPNSLFLNAPETAGRKELCNKLLAEIGPSP